MNPSCQESVLLMCLDIINRIVAMEYEVFGKVWQKMATCPKLELIFYEP